MLKKIVFILIATLFVSTIEIYSQPKLEIVGGSTYDWGEVTPKDNPLKATIKLKNTGTATLQVLRVKPTCGCTTAPLSQNILEPGETAELDVTLKITGYSGNVTKHINIYTDDPNSKAKVIDLKAFVKRPITISPSGFINLKRMQVGYLTSGSCIIKNTSGENITLSNVRVSPADANVNLKKNITIKPGEEYKLILSVKPNKPGSYRAKVEISSSHPDFPELTIHAYGSADKSPLFNNN